MAGWGRVDNQNLPRAPRVRPYPVEIRRPNEAEDPEMTLAAMLTAGTSGVQLNGGNRPRQETGNNSEDRIRRGLQFRNAQLGQIASPTEQKGQEGRVFRNPTDVNGIFARSMSQITCNPSSASQGSVTRSIELNNQFNNQLQMALAIQLGLNGQQMVKERALHNVLTSESARGDVKQILQSRAEIYGDALDPN